MAKNSAEDVLKSVPLFEGLSKGEIKDVAAQAREELYSPGQDIITEGQAGGPFFCITEGRAEILVGDNKIGEYGPGAAFGEMALLEGSKRSATIRAQTHVKAVAITSWNFLALLQDNWDLTKKILATLSKRIRDLETDNH